MDPISEAMAAALMLAREHGGKLIRLPGGYWTFEGCPWSGSAPTQHFGTTTIEGLVRRGHMTYTQWRRKTKKPGEFPIEVEVVVR